MNNTNVYNDRPGENGEWPEESLTNGEFVTRQTGGEFFWQNKAKGIENSLTANAEWSDRDVNRNRLRRLTCRKVTVTPVLPPFKTWIIWG